jgi:hypothetical protein
MVGIASGFRWSGGDPFTGEMGFGIIINRTLTTDERQKPEGYAVSLFGL